MKGDLGVRTCPDQMPALHCTDCLDRALRQLLKRLIMLQSSSQNAGKCHGYCANGNYANGMQEIYRCRQAMRGHVRLSCWRKAWTGPLRGYCWPWGCQKLPTGIGKPLLQQGARQSRVGSPAFLVNSGIAA